jgi:hypothetical protein
MHDFEKSLVGGIGGTRGGHKNQRGMCLKQEATVQPFCKPILRYTGLVLLSGPEREAIFAKQYSDLAPAMLSWLRRQDKGLSVREGFLSRGLPTTYETALRGTL